MSLLPEKLAGAAAKRHWIFIVAWVVVLGGALGLSRAFGGEYVNNYTISGSDSATGLSVAGADGGDSGLGGEPDADRQRA